MRILHAVPAYHPEGPGGIETYVRGLVQAQRERGHEPIVLTGCADIRSQPVVERGEVDGVDVLRLYRDDPFCVHHTRAHHGGVARLVEQLLAERRPDLLHVHHWLRLTSDLVQIAERNAVPTVVTLHDTYTSCPRCYRVDAAGAACARTLSTASCAPCVHRWGDETEAEVADGIERFARSYRAELAAARAVVAASHALPRFLAERADLTGFAAQVLPMPYRARGTDTAAMQGDDAPLRFAHWGNLGHHKGTSVLLDAVRRLQTTSPFELHLLGPCETPELEQELRLASEQLPVFAHGRFTYDDLRRIHPQVAIVPSIAWETFSYTLEEAFDLGLPCIVSDVGVLPERVGSHGITVPAGDADALAAAMADVLERPDRVPAGAASRGCDYDQHTAQLGRIYRDVRRS